MPVNILGVEFEDDVKRTAEMVIIDPDYLIDVSALFGLHETVRGLC